MLLTEWASSLGLPVEARRCHLDQVHRFVFGDSYMIQMMDGRTYEDKNLETVLDIMENEFRVFNTTLILQAANLEKNGLYPVMELLSVGKSTVPSTSDPLGLRKGLQLVVSVVKGWSAKAGMPPPDIDAVIVAVRQSVTMFSLTGEWNQFKKDNL